MYKYERSYKTGRAVATWVEAFGWGIVGLGALIALAGFATGGLLGSLVGGFDDGDTPIVLRVFALLPGVVVSAVGLVSVMLVQHTRATIDTAEMTREMLAIARGTGSAAAPDRKTEPPSATAAKPGLQEKPGPQEKKQGEKEKILKWR